MASELMVKIISASSRNPHFAAHNASEQANVWLINNGPVNVQSITTTPQAVFDKDSIWYIIYVTIQYRCATPTRAAQAVHGGTR